MVYILKKIWLRILEAFSHPWLLAIVIVIGLVILLDISPVGGNYRTYIAWFKCGHEPIAAITSLGDRFYYSPSFYEPIQLFQPDNYYCTAQEAEAAGYEPSLSYEIHHQ